jgi:MscS family membrane protein
MDKTRLIDFDTIPNKTRKTEWVFARYGEKDQEQKIALRLQKDKRWLFSSETLEQLPDIVNSLKQKTTLVVDSKDDLKNQPLASRLRTELPDDLQVQLWGLYYWQWLGIVVFIVLGIIADWVFSGLARLLTRIISTHAEALVYQQIRNGLFRPFGLMVMALVWWLGINQLSLPEPVLLVLLVAVKFFASISGVWGAYRLVDLLSAWMQKRASKTENKVDDALVPLAKRTLKVLVTVIGLVFIANNLNINITGLVAGLGLGGLALALASKDLAQNILGTITILIEGTFSVGDWIVIDDIEGNVEDIGFRSTRIRTFYNSLITLPNANFITNSVDNLGKRRYRRLSTKLGITYQTPADKVEGFCEGIRELVRLHPYMRKDYYQVYFNGYADSALEILVYVFWETPDWNTELREKHRFLLDILRLARQMDIEFAYPTQTLFMQDMQDKAAKSQESQSINDATLAARQVARNIVEKNTSLSDKPAPVSIDSQPLSINPHKNNPR